MAGDVIMETKGCSLPLWPSCPDRAVAFSLRFL